jgi:hypothetical protein
MLVEASSILDSKISLDMEVEILGVSISTKICQQMAGALTFPQKSER